MHPPEVASAAACLKSVGASRVWLFGSYAEGQQTSASDIDILVEGIELEHVLDAIATASAASGRFVDLVPAQPLSHELRAFILKSAVEL